MKIQGRHGHDLVITKNKSLHKDLTLTYMDPQNNI